MNILTLSNSDKNGGAARAAYRIFSSLEKYDINNKMLVKNKLSNSNYVLEASAYNNTGITKLKEDVLWKVRNRIRKHQWKKYNVGKDAYLSDMFSINLNRALNTIDYDILHLHWINGQFLDINELVEINKPIVWTLHDAWPFTGICHIFYECEKYKSKCGCCPYLNSNKEKDFSRMVWVKKSKVYENKKIYLVSPSNWLAKAAKESLLFKNNEIKIIPNCINTDTYHPIDKVKAKEILNLAPEKKYILFGASNSTKDRNKGYHLIIQSIEKLSGKKINNTELLIVGSDEVKKSSLFGFPVNYIGHLYDDYSLTMFYSAADVTLVPSLSENLSNVIMESMACGTPVVAFDVGGNSDLIEHEKNGYLAKPYDTSCLADGIEWCIANNGEKKLSEKARDKVINNFTQDRVARMYLDMYESFLV